MCDGVVVVVSTVANFVMAAAAVVSCICWRWSPAATAPPGDSSVSGEVSVTAAKAAAAAAAFPLWLERQSLSPLEPGPSCSDPRAGLALSSLSQQVELAPWTDNSVRALTHCSSASGPGSNCLISALLLPLTRPGVAVASPVWLRAARGGSCRLSSCPPSSSAAVAAAVAATGDDANEPSPMGTGPGSAI